MGFLVLASAWDRVEYVYNGRGDGVEEKLGSIDLPLFFSLTFHLIFSPAEPHPTLPMYIINASAKIHVITASPPELVLVACNAV